MPLKKKSVGICSSSYCHRVTEGGNRFCNHHLENARKRKKKFRAKAKKEGQCRRTDCTNMARPGLSRCEKCASWESIYMKTKPVKLRLKEWRGKLRKDVLDAYGGRCLCCGEPNLRFLTIDHEMGYDGKSPRRGDHLYLWLKTKGFPSGFRVLCIGCNAALGHYGYCPHGDLKQIIKPKRKGPLKRTTMQAIYQRNYWFQYRMRVFQEYGGAICKCCGETYPELLTIDHINNDGAAHRRKDKKAVNIYRWLTHNGFPPGYQVLCMNCNFAKGKYGKCPHELKPLEVS